MASSPTSAPYVPFSRRPEWAGVRPIPQPENPGGLPPVVPIDYPDEYREATAYLRAAAAAGDRSAKALALTAEVIEMNAAHYTAWYYRRRCLEALVGESGENEEAAEAAYRQEMEYTAKVAAENPKNYQVWHHRQAVIAQWQDPTGELDYVAEALQQGDAKNYHVWAYRQWLLRTFSLWDGELDFVASLLAADRRNNSAWNQRWFVVATHELAKCKEAGSAVAAAIGAREVAFTLQHIAADMGNESPWHYLRGHLRRVGFDGARLGTPDLKTRLLEMAATEAGKRCVPLQALLVEVYEREGEEAGLAEAAQICETLATELDPVRVRFWLGTVQARIHRRLVADIAPPSAANASAAATLSSS